MLEWDGAWDGAAHGDSPLLKSAELARGDAFCESAEITVLVGGAMKNKCKQA